jgi:alpha-mannosidase
VAQAAIDDALPAIAAQVDTGAMREPVVVFNAATASRTDVVEIGTNSRTVEVPGLGYVTVDAAAPAPDAGAVVATPTSLENALLRIAWDGDGLLTSIHDKQSGREILAPGARGNLLQVFRDHPSDYDAWEIDADDLRAPTDITECESIEPTRSGVCITRRHNRSTITQTITLAPHSRRVDFHTVIDWQETHRLLKVAFPTRLRSDTASYDVGFGHVRRPTHENTSWDAAMFEVPAQRFADLSEPDYGVALLTRDKHGFDVRGGILRLTLLRAPTAPDPQADRGVHEFTYALLPHPGDVVAGGVHHHAEAFEIPLRIVPTVSHAGDLPSSGTLLALDGDAQVLVTAVKKSERGSALIVRVCEVHGTHGTVTVTPQATTRTKNASRTDILERPTAPPPQGTDGHRLQLRPFELATLRFEPPPP